jgi:hypothetical protein
MRAEDAETDALDKHMFDQRSRLPETRVADRDPRRAPACLEMTTAVRFSYGPMRPEKAKKIETTDPRVSGGCGRRRRPRAAAGQLPGVG